MSESILTHPALVSIPAAVAVIISFGMFLRHMTILGKSRDEERNVAMTVITRIGEDFTDSLRQFNESRLTEQKEMMEFYRQQSICMQAMIDQCKARGEKS